MIWKLVLHKKSERGMGQSRIATGVVFQDEDDLQDAQFQVAERMVKMVDKLGGDYGPDNDK